MLYYILSIVIFVLFSNNYLFSKEIITAEEKDFLLNSNLHESEDWLNLLHYSSGRSKINKNSDFFISENGWCDPHDEFLATVNELHKPIDTNNCSVVCRFPARTAFLLKSCGSSITNISPHKCEYYNTYNQAIIPEHIYVVFASESNSSFESMMGHSFLKIEGNNISHAFSYAGIVENQLLFQTLWNHINNNINGYYALSPFKTQVDKYINKENRSLWEFEILLSDEQKQNLLRHLWELKGKNLSYNFITHNCSTALLNILKVANIDFNLETYKPFITPIEYIQYLFDKNLIVNSSIIPSEKHKEIVKAYGLNFIVNAPPPSRITCAYEIKKDTLNFSFSPIYHDLHDISDAYFSEQETKLLEINFEYNFRNNKTIFNNINLLKRISIVDTFLLKTPCTYLRIGFDNDVFSLSNELKPTLEFGLGLGLKLNKSTTIYALPKLGYHYDDVNNFYLCPAIGASTTLFNRIKFIISYEPYLDSNDQNRGFKSRANVFCGYKINNSFDIHIDYSRYEEAIHKESIKFGMTYHF